MLALMKGGIVEERLREWVKRRLRRRGTAAALARHLTSHGLRKSDATEWVSLYKSGERDADLDMAAEIAVFFNQTLAAIVGDEPLSEIDRDIDRDAIRLRDLPSGDQDLVRRLITSLWRQAER